MRYHPSMFRPWFLALAFAWLLIGLSGLAARADIGPWFAAGTKAATALEICVLGDEGKDWEEAAAEVSDVPAFEPGRARLIWAEATAAAQTPVSIQPESSSSFMARAPPC